MQDEGAHSTHIHSQLETFRPGVRFSTEIGIGFPRLTAIFGGVSRGRILAAGADGGALPRI